MYNTADSWREALKFLCGLAGALNPAQFGDEIFAYIALNDVATYASGKRGPLESARIVLANDKNLNRGKFLPDHLGCLQTIHVRHRDVEQYDVRMMFSDFVEGVRPIDGFAHNFDVGLGTKNLTDAATHTCIVVNDNDTKCGRSHGARGQAFTRLRVYLGYWV
jgi:hypothetical protein